jgi:hypothetical protein
MVDMQDLLLRAVEIEKAGLLTLGITCDAKPYFIHQQETFPYWTNRIADIGVEFDSENIDTYTVDITARLVIDHRTAGYKGEKEAALYKYIPTMIGYFNARELLQSAAYLAEPLDLIQARVTAVSGLRIYETSGLSALQVGTEFTITCTVPVYLEQAYT